MLVRVRRVDQLLSALGYCTRSEAQRLCDAGRVVCLAPGDGAAATPDTGGRREHTVGRASERVDPELVRLDGEPLDHPGGLLVALHKPTGFVCSHQSSEGRLVYELLPARWRRRSPPVTTIGRLDKDTSGLLLVTDVGPLVHKLSSPKHHVEKTYRASVDRPLGEAEVAAFARGLTLEGEAAPTLPAKLVITGPTEAEVTVVEGRYHQVRRMFAACGRHVVSLERIRFGPWSLGALAEGGWRLEAVPPAVD